jgi:UDP-N-acetylglucosamine 2-epimerase
MPDAKSITAQIAAIKEQQPVGHCESGERVVGLELDRFR